MNSTKTAASSEAMTQQALRELVERRIPEALKRITDGYGLMRVPAEDTDPDLVLADCLIALKALLGEQREAQGEEPVWYEMKDWKTGNFFFSKVPRPDSVAIGWEQRALYSAPPLAESVGDELNPKALEALKSYQQADRDGIMVNVSRQALDEAIAILERRHMQQGK